MNIHNKGHNLTALRGLGVVSGEKSVLLFLEDPTKDIREIHIASSTNGLSFKTRDEHLNLQDFNPHKDRLSDLRISKRADEYFMTYKKEGETGLILASSSELLHFGTLSEITDIHETGMIIPDYKRNGKYAMIYGDTFLHLAFSANLKQWKTESYPLLTPNNYNWEQKTNVSLHLGTIITLSQGIVVLYYIQVQTDDETTYALQAVMVDKKDPKKLLFQSEMIWDNTEEWARNKVTPIGVVFYKNRLISYWNYDQKGIFSIQHAGLTHLLRQPDQNALFLKRVDANPMITPSNNPWENKATFNPGAVVKDESVHMVYRAIGEQDLSVIGYAKSDDGITLSSRLDKPVFVSSVLKKAPYDSAIRFMSGGGYGGCEDPRLTRINGRIYMTYVAYDGWSEPRAALTSIPEEDFFNENFDAWDDPVLISRPGVVNKNAVIFPEKVKGKYVIMHRIFPDILIDYRDTLTFGEGEYLRGDEKIRPRKLSWDSRKIGAGPPPLLTKYGWLLIYHSVGDQEPGRYKMGAMLLEKDNPSSVVARSKKPILTPDHPHENNGYKAGVAYPCGAVRLKNKLIVYYGGADSVTLAAEANLDAFLDELVSQKQPALQQISLS